MKNILKALTIGALIIPNLTQGAPFTFNYHVVYDFSSTSIYGTEATVHVTVDNGSTSSASQNYYWDDVTNFSVTTNGTPGWTNLSPFTNSVDPLNNTVMLTTDSSGQHGSFLFGGESPMLQINYTINNTTDYAHYLYQQIGAGYELILYDFERIGAYPDPRTNPEGPFVDPVIIQKIAGKYINPEIFQTRGATYGLDAVLATSIPEPSTLAIMGLGFAGMGYVRRRKSAPIKLAAHHLSQR